MFDRKITISNLDTNIRWIEEIPCHQFPGWGNVTMSMRDALELLKEQEPIAPYQFEDIWKCGKCGNGVVGYEELAPGGIEETRFDYCPMCGRKVKWNEI